MTNWKFATPANKAVFRTHPDGTSESCLIVNPDYIAYVAAGNITDPADPPPPAVDYSDSANIDKTLQALMLCIAQVGGLTIPQAKALFKQKFNLLP